VLIVVEDRDVELLAQPLLDLEAARRGDVLEVDPAEGGSLVSSGSGNASTPASSLKSMALPSITGIAASGPMSPSPSTAVPSVTTATALCLIVSVKARLGSSLIARQTRATPGV
jgi:hypothetical protein